MTSFRQFRAMLAESVEQIDEGLKDGYYVTNHEGKKVGDHHKDSKSAIRTADKNEDATGKVHTVHHVKGGKIVKQWQFQGGHHDSGWMHHDDYKGEEASSHIRESVEQISEEEEKEYTVVADISHPFNRGLSVTKHFKHKAKSPEHAVKAAKDHIKSQGWKVHSASVRGNVSEESIDLIEAIEEATIEAEQIDEISKKTLHSYVQKSSADLAKHRNISKVIDPEGKADTPEKAKYAHRQFKRYRGLDDADGKLKGDSYTKVKATD